MLAGCASSNAPAPLRVALPADCESILQPVPMPQVKAGDSLRSALAKHRAALHTADSTIDAGRECVADQRKAYEAAR